MGHLLWGLVVVLMVIKLVFGIASVLFHLLLVAAVPVALYAPIRAGASRKA